MKVAHVFSGFVAEQCASTPLIAEELLQRCPAVAQIVEQCEDLAPAWSGGTLRSVLLGDSPVAQVEPELGHTAWLVAQVAVHHQLAAWGLEAEAVVGYGGGEIAAMYAAEAISLEDCLQLARARANVLRLLPTDRVLCAVQASLTEVSARLARFAGVELVAHNAPDACVVAGTPGDVQQLREHLHGLGIVTTRLGHSRVLPSSAAERCSGKFAEVARQVTFAPPQVLVMSSTTGSSGIESMLDAAYWESSLHAPIRWVDCIEALCAAGTELFVEVAPCPVVAPFVDACTRGTARCVPAGLHGRGAYETLLELVAERFRHGARPRWDRILAKGARIALPGYPFERRAHWVDETSSSTGDRRENRVDAQAPLGPRLAIPGPELHHSATLHADDVPLLREHLLYGQVVVPGAYYLSALLTIAGEMWGKAVVAIENVTYHSLLVLTSGTSIHLKLRPVQGEAYEFEITSRSGDPAAELDATWTLHASGTLRRGEFDAEHAVSARPPAASGRRNDAGPLFDLFADAGVSYGEGFRWIREYWSNEATCTVRYEQPESPHPPVGVVSTGLLDSFMQSVATLLSLPLPERPEDPFLPMQIQSLRVYAPATRQLWGRVTRRDLTPDKLQADLDVVDENGKRVAELRGIVLRRAAADRVHRMLESSSPVGFYQMVWQTHDLDADVPDAAQDGRGTWLVAGRDPLLEQAIAERLSTQGQACVRIDNGAASESFERAIERLARSGEPVRGLVYVASTPKSAQPEQDDAPDPMSIEQQTYPSLLDAVQQLLQLRSTCSPRLVFVTRAAQVTGRDSSLQLPGATLAGFVRVLANEHPECRPLHVDLERLESPEEDAARVLTAVASETPDTQVVFRGGEALVPRLQRYRGPRKAPAPGVIRDDASYLVSGGLGALGLHTARWLAEQGAKHLVLLSRTGGRPTEGPALAALRERGVQVRVEHVDVADYAELAALLGRTLPELPPLRGIVHAAGVLDDGTLTQQTWERFEKVLSPKVGGAWNLHLLTGQMDLDFFVLFSSMSGVLGTPGQSSYAAANAFLDQLAAYRAQQGLKATSIAWGAWSGGGMSAARSSGATRRQLLHGVTPITPAQGTAALGEALSLPFATVGAVDIEWRRLMAQFAPAKVPGLLEQWAYLAVDDGRGLQVGELKRTLAEIPNPYDRAEKLEACLAEQARAVLRLEASDVIEPERPLSELGLDSVMALELRTDLADALDVEVPVSAVFEYPTIRRLAGFLLAQLNLGPAAKSDEPGAASDEDKQAEHDAAREGLRQSVVALTDDSAAREIADVFGALQKKLS